MADVLVLVPSPTDPIGRCGFRAETTAGPAWFPPSSEIPSSPAGEEQLGNRNTAGPGTAFPAKREPVLDALSGGG
jgi:hypothetical protein